MRKLVGVLLAMALVLAACAPAVSSKDITSQYERSVGAYYDVIAGATSFSDAEQVVSAAIASAPQDLELRMVQAQLELFWYRTTKDEPHARAVVRALEVVESNLEAGTAAAAWVRPRLYVTFGDLLIVRSGALRAAADGDTNRWAALAYLLAARRYYNAGRLLVESAATNGGTESEPTGPTRERYNARTGLLEGDLGVVAVLAEITGAESRLEQPSSEVARLDDGALSEMTKLINDDSLDNPADTSVFLETPSSVVPLRLDEGLHNTAMVAFQTLTRRTLDARDQACINGTAGTKFDEVVASWRRAAYRWAFHAVIAAELGGQNQVRFAADQLRLAVDSGNGRDAVCSQP